MIFNYAVEIHPIETIGDATQNISDIGMFAGVIRWVTAYNTEYDNTNSSITFLSEKWIGSLTKSVTIERTGNYAATSGGEIKIIGSKEFFKWLVSYGISINNAVVRIKESVDGGAYSDIRVGIVEQTQNKINTGSIPFKDLSKSTETSITKEIGESGKFYPVSFGRMENAKTTNVPSQAYTPDEIGASGEKSFWEAESVNITIGSPSIWTVILKSPYSVGVSDIDIQDFQAEVEDKSGLGLKQGDVIMPIASIGLVGGSPEKLSVVISNNKPTTGDGIVASSAVDDFTEIVAFGQNAHSDFFDGEIISETITNYNEDAESFESLPFVRDEEQWVDNTVSIVDSDSAGWDLLQGECYNVRGVQWHGGGISTPVLSGDAEYVTDGDETTYVEYTTTGGGLTFYSQASLYALTRFTPQEKPDTTAFVCNCECDLTQIHSSYKFRIFFRAIDSFGKTYDIGGTPRWEFTPFDYTLGVFSGMQKYLNNTCSKYLDVTEGGGFEKWTWSSSGAASSLAGYRQELDLSVIPEMSWRSGIVIESAFNVYDDLGRSQLSLINFRLRQLQFLGKSDFQSDEVYVDVQGRKDQDSSNIETLPEVYKHLLKLQNYTNRGTATPSGSWGLEYPAISDWSGIYNNSDFSEFGSDATYFQIMDKASAGTEKIKSKICSNLWAIGLVDDSGIERLIPMVAELYNTGGVQITYGDLYGDDLPKPIDRKFSSIFTDAAFTYGYNTATQKALYSAVVDGTDKDSYEETSSTASPNIWNMARALYLAYNIQNETPKGMTEALWITTEESFETYMENFYKWQGVDDRIARKRYTVTLKLPYKFAHSKGLDLGVGIQLSMPNLTYYGAVEGFHSGVISSISKSIGTISPHVTIIAEMVGDAVAGSGRVVYRETGIADKNIRETGTQTEIIREGYYGD